MENKIDFNETEEVFEQSVQIEILYEELQNKIKILEKQIASYEKDNNKKDSLIKELKNAKIALEKELQEYKSKIKGTIKEKNKLEIELAKIKQKLEKTNETIEVLTKNVDVQDCTNKNLADKLEKIEEEKKELEVIAQGERIKLEVYTNKEQRLLELQTIEKEILLLLSKRQVTIKEIKEELNNKGFIITNEELQSLLTKIRSKINISLPFKTIPETFCVERINPKANNIENNSYKLILNKEKEIKILLVADAHSDMKSLSSFDVYKSLYDYSLKNNITNIFLLGDLFDCSCNYDITKKEELYDTIKYYQENIAIFLDKYPQCDEITNSFLGGNHERMMFDVGISLTDVIANSRLDFVSLGYNDAVINVENNFFAVHHPNRVANSSKEEAVKNYLKKYYNNSNSKKSYIDIFGHFHTNCFNPTNGYLILPSLTRNGNDVKGACEMQILLNEDGYIENIIFYPLVFNRKSLVSSCEIEYKKLTLKK